MPTLTLHDTTLKSYASANSSRYPQLSYDGKTLPILGQYSASLCISRYVVILFPIHQSAERNQTEPLLNLK